MKNISAICIIAMFISSCNLIQRDTIKIIIDPSNYGWYFVELHKDPTLKDPDIIILRFEGGLRLQGVNVSDYDKFNFKIFDGQRREISSRMKLAEILSHHSGRTFFEFYNPTAHELSSVKKWMQPDPLYREIATADEQELEKLLKSN